MPGAISRLQEINGYGSDVIRQFALYTTTFPIARPIASQEIEIMCAWFDMARKDGVDYTDAEVIDLRWLDRASIDWDTIGASIKKTNKVLIAEQGSVGTSYGSWLADEINRRYFDYLDAPVERVTGKEASPSISKVLERAAIARTEEVVTKLNEMNTNNNLKRK
jgi:pyruvate/2-oxoglutarate/acetoin dehydrogenase E1 component